MRAKWILTAAVVTAAWIPLLSGGCADAAGAVFHYPGVGDLMDKGMPALGTGLPPGAQPPSGDAPEPTERLPLLEKYRNGN